MSNSLKPLSYEFPMSESTEKTLDVLALGEAMLEFNQTQEAPPLYLQGFGGDTSNAAIAAARAGARVGYLSRLGQDHWGHLLMQLWAREGVDTRGVLRDTQAPSGVYFVSHDARGHHFSYARAGSAASRMQASDVQAHWAALIGQSRWLHLSGISLAISPSASDAAFAAMHAAREQGTRIAFDSNLRLSLWPIDRARACISEAVRLCDLFLPSMDDMVALTGLQSPDRVLDWSHAHGAQQVVLKLGAEGAIVSHGAQRTPIAPQRVQALDATGAGDCFAGNLLARLCRGDDLATAARYANAAAALSVQGRGAVDPLPTPEAVQALL
jgi:2-dehydro-3-deoxygluconokinase